MPSEKQEGTEHILKKYRIPYSEVFRFEDVEDLLLFNKKKYKVLISVSLYGRKMFVVNSVSDSVAGQKFIEEDFKMSEWY